MSGIRVAAHLRELERASPRLLLKAMDNSGQRSSAGAAATRRSLPAGRFPYADGGTTFVILFDPTTHLPAAIRTRDDDNIAGDSNYDLVLGDWTNVGGGAGRNVAVLSDQRHRSREDELFNRHARPAICRRMRSPFPLRSSRPPSRPPPQTCPINGCCAGCSSRGSRTAMRSSIPTAERSSSSSWRPTCSTSRAAPPTI